jgi:SAM-dependent methyltransferase
MLFPQLRFRAHKKAFAGKIGLEIGGPSAVFQGTDYLPMYPWASRIDGINFSTQTLWEGAISEGPNYRYAEGRCGHQYVGESSELNRFEDASYDFVLSSHSLEHSANALKTVAAWTRVLKPGGTLLVVVPDHRETFDRRRPVTSFAHLLDDFEKNVGEDDLTHLEEVVKLHDFTRDLLSKSPEEFRERCSKNFETRILHHHVFDLALMRRVFEHFGIRPNYERVVRGHVITMGTKSRDSARR